MLSAKVASPEPSLASPEKSASSSSWYSCDDIGLEEAGAAGAGVAGGDAAAGEERPRFLEGLGLRSTSIGGGVDDCGTEDDELGTGNVAKRRGGSARTRAMSRLRTSRKGYPAGAADSAGAAQRVHTSGSPGGLV